MAQDRTLIEQQIADALADPERAKDTMKLRDLQGVWEQFMRKLRCMEEEVWQPHWSHDDPIIDRMARVGYPRETVDAMKTHLEFIYRLVRGEARRPLQKVQEGIDAVRATEDSAMEQLAAIVVAAHSGQVD